MKRFLFGVFLGGTLATIFIGTMFTGIARRSYDKGKEAGKEIIIAEAIHAGAMRGAREDARGYKWIVRKHSSQRRHHPHEDFYATDEMFVQK